MAHATVTFQLSHMRHKEEQVEGQNGSKRAKGGVDQGVAQIGRQDYIRQEATLPANAVNLYEAKRQTEAAKQTCVSKIPLPPLLKKPLLRVGSMSTQLHSGQGHQARVAASELKEWHR